MMRNTIIVLLIITTLSIPDGLQSHPHLFIKPSIEIIKTGQNSAAIKMTWEWDKWWSREVISECDKNKNGYFEPSEVNLVFRDYFNGIRNSGFFTQIYLNGKRVRFNSVNNFSAYINNDDIVTYSFIIPLNIDITGTAAIRICFNDETIYAAFDQTVKLIKNSDINYTRISIKEFSYYGTEVQFDISPAK